MNTTDDDGDENQHRALQNEYILEHLFSFLSLNDIKNCRFANRTWRNIGAKFLRKKAHILFDFRNDPEIARYPAKKIFNSFLEKKNYMKEVANSFKGNLPSNTPISSFAFVGEFQYCPLQHFLKDVGSFTTELKIHSTVNHYNQRFKFIMDPKITPVLTKLHLSFYPQSPVTFNLCFDHIPLVKDIYLDYCKIVVETNEKRLSPSHITLGSGNTYSKNGVRGKFLVNESFDLTLTKHINLSGKRLILDFSECANGQVERTVTLNAVNVRNWEMCNWKIKKFSLDGIPFLHTNFIEMKELRAENLRIDLSKIYNPLSLLTNSSLSFDNSSFIKDIYLDHCKIVVDTNEKRLSPSHSIILGSGNTYSKNKIRVKFLVNESFDLTLTKHINLSGKRLILDFSNYANDQVERNVTLKDITVLNWEMCNWKIKKFSLDGIPFLHTNFIEIEDLRAANLRIDLSKIYNPTSLLKLDCQELTVIAQAPFCLPSLVDLTLECDDWIPRLHYFSQSKSISKLWLKSENDHVYAMSININDLPQGIRDLGLGTLNVYGELSYPLDTLFIGRWNHPSYKYERITSKFQVNNLRIIFDAPSTDEQMQNVISLLDANTSYRRLIIGKFSWAGSEEFNNSVISKFVDTMAEYYIFEGKRGKGFTKAEADMFQRRNV